MKRSIWLLVLIFTLGLALRVVNLASYPIGFTPDEAAFGYNAFTLLFSGKDEWGVPAYLLPFTNLKSFGDYKLPLYVFLSVPSVAVFGLNEFATRLPNALIGSLSILSVFFLSLKLSRSRFVALAAAFFQAVSPWGIGLSRGAFEANLATFFQTLAIYFQLNSQPVSSSLFYAFSFYSYHSARFLIFPVIIISELYKFMVNGSTQVSSLKKYFVLIILLIPGIISLFSTGFSRVSDVGIFKPNDNWQALLSDRFTAIKAGLPPLLAKFYYAKPLSVSTQVVSNYLGYFSPQFLFASGAGETTYGLMPGTGLLYLVALPLVVIFLAQLSKRPTGPLIFLVLMLLIMPLPAALSKGPGFAANRAVLMLPFLSVISAFGLKYVSRHRFLAFSIILLTLVSLSQFLVKYSYQSPSILAEGMLFGRRELVTRLSQLDSPLVRMSKTLSESHIYLAFYQQIPPQVYQQAALNWPKLGQNGFIFLDQTDFSLGNYQFSQLSFGGNNPQILLVGRPQDFEFNYPYLFRIHSPSGQPLIQVSALRI